MAAAMTESSTSHAGDLLLKFIIRALNYTQTGLNLRLQVFDSDLQINKVTKTSLSTVEAPYSELPACAEVSCCLLFVS